MTIAESNQQRGDNVWSPAEVARTNSLIAERYQVVDSLRQSTTGVTFIGEEKNTGQQVIIKSIATRQLTHGTAARFEHEASIRRELNSEWLAPVLHFGQDDGQSFVVMPMVTGVSLSTRLKRGPIAIEDALNLGKFLFSSLSDLHQRGGLHRDIKPRNLITNEGESIRWAKLVDIGTIRNFNPDELVGDQQRAIVTYMSPEQAGSIDSDVGAPSDLYAAGVVLFECLTGRPPFTGRDAGTILFEHLTTPIPPLQELNPDVPRELDEVVQRLLRKDPFDRYQLASAVVKDIEAIYEATTKDTTNFQIAIGSTDRRCTLTAPAFVARTAELDTLTSLIYKTCRGHGGLAFVEAESGGGKTRLLVEVAKQAKRDGVWVLRGEETTNVGQRPFQLLDGIVDAFLTFARAEPRQATEIRKSLAGYADALCASLPRLREVLSPEQPEGPSPVAFGETRTIQALAKFLDAISSKSRPVVIILDDCQWADALTHKLLRRWQAQQTERYTSIIPTYRSEEVSKSHALRSIPYDVLVELKPFGRNEIKQLAESMAGALPTDALEVVVQMANGSPFMASAVLRGLVETGALLPEDGSWRVDSEAIVDLQSSRKAADFLTQRIELLPASTLHLLSIGAVIGKEFGLDIVSALADITTTEALELLIEARERHLIWARPDGGQFVFVHDRIRASVLERLSPNERSDVHCRAALHLQSNTPELSPAIAYHFDAAGRSEDALDHALKAAEQAQSQFSLAVAEQQYRIARRGAKRASPRLQFRIAEGLGNTLMLKGRYADAAPLFEEAAALADERITRAQIQGKLAELSFKRGDMETATAGVISALRTLGRFVPQSTPLVVVFLLWEVIQQLLHTFFPWLLVQRMKREPSESESLEMRLYSLLAHGCWYCRSKIECCWAHLRGLNLAERFSPTAELANAYAEHACVMCLVPLFGRAEHYARRSLELRKSFNDVWGQGQALNYYSCVLYAASRFHECVEKGRASVRLLERTGDYWQVHIARYQVAASLYHLGDFEGAIEEAKLNHQSGIELGDEQASGIILDVWMRASNGGLDDEILSVELNRERHDAQGLTQVLLAEGIRHLHANRFELARDTFESASRVAANAGIHNAYTLPVLAWLATAWRCLAEETSLYAPQERQKVLQQAARAARAAVRSGRICKNDLPRALREDALVSAMLGRHRTAQRRLNQSLELARSLKDKYEIAETMCYMGKLGCSLTRPDCDAEIAEAIQLREAFFDRNIHGQSSKAHEDDSTLSLADRFQTVLEAGRRIASALSAAKVYEEAQAAALRLLRGEHCRLLEFENPERAGESPILVEADETISSEMVQAAIKANRAIAFDEELPDNSPSSQTGDERSALCAPIHVRGQLTTCLYVTHSQVKGLFGPHEERLADFVAAIAGAALENAQGFQQLESLNATLEQRVAERTEAAEARAAELTQSNQNLERTANELLFAEEQLLLAKEHAEAANEAKSRFLATMSHEIRTPLNGVLGMTEIALRTPLSRQQRNCLTVVRQSGEALLNLLNDILDFSKIEAGKMVLEEIAIEPKKVIIDAAKLMGASAAQKNVELICRISPELPTQIMGDPCRLRQILVNLVGNAIKFTDEGEVFVNAVIEQNDGDAEMLHVSVRDTGPGIPQEKQAAIFESFQQSDISTTRRFGGTGLGLSISAQLVSLMEGRLWVESEVGEGSTFHFAIPLHRVYPENKIEQLSLLAGHRVLIACNRETSRNTYREILTDSGATCHFIPNTVEAWLIVEEYAESTGEDQVLLIDIESDSLENNGLLKTASSARLSSMPTIVLTPTNGLLLDSNEVEFEPKGRLAKPISDKELIDTILEATKQTSETDVKTAPIPIPSAERSLHVLVADDSSVNQEVAAGILELFGHTCELVSNGREAVEAFRDGTFDTILMDLEMPVMDGATAAKGIRDLESELGSYTPIIALTAHALTGVREQCIEAGMDDYLSKPLEPDSLIRALQQLTSSVDESACASRC